MRAVELFCCAGGMAEGFRRAGIAFDLAFDRDINACDSYEANLGHRPVQVDAHDLVRLARSGMRPEIDLLVADPPCTPWSRAGKRQGLDDPNDCLRVTVELITLWRPRAYLIGNVPGLDDSVNLPVIHEVFEPLREAGYCTADYRQMDAADYGVPQHRIRPFWFGHLDGPCLRWPATTHCDPAMLATRTLFGDQRRPWVTCAEALAHLPPEDLGTPVRLRWKDGGEGGDHRSTRPDEPAKTITRNTHSDGALLVLPNHQPHYLHEPAKTITAGDGEGAKRVLAASRKHPPHEGSKPAHTVRAAKPGGGKDVLLLNPKHPPAQADEPAPTLGARDRGGQGANVLAWPWDRPSTSIPCDPRICPPGHHGPGEQRGPGAVKLSERAAAILQGFPDTWKFCGPTKKARWAQLGMAMPPPLAHAVATAIVQWFCDQERPPCRE